MNEGLLYLLWRQQLAPLRKARSYLRGIKGVLISLAVLAFLAVVIGPQFVASSALRSSVGFTEMALDFGPHLLLLVTCFVSFAVGGLYFTPGEITYLFPAPIPRYQLLIFNVLSRLSTQLLSGAFMALFVFAWCPTWYGGVIGSILVMLFFQLTSQCAGLFFATLGARFADFLQRFGSILILVLIGASILLMRELGAATEDEGWLGAVRAWQRLPVVDQLAWLTRPFVETLCATYPGEFLRWGAICVGILGAELGLMFWLDVAFMERALANSQRLQRRLERMRSGGGAMAAAGPGKAHFGLPQLPSLWGAGPLVWKQLTEMIRHPRPLFATILMMGAWMIPIFYLPDYDGEESAALPSAALVGVFFMSTMITVQLNFDFRRDVDRMAYLRSLPLSAHAVASGQIFPNCLLICVLQLFAVIVLFILAPLPVTYVVIYSPAIFLINWISVALDNTVFLLYPYRMAPKDPGQFQFVGRLALAMFAKMMAFMTVLGCAALPAGLIWEFTDSIFAASAVASVILLAFATACTWLCARSFLRFDPGRDIP